MTTLHQPLPQLTRRSQELPISMRALMRLLARLERGALHLETPDGHLWRLGPGGAPIPGGDAAPAIVTFHDRRIAADVLKGGDVAFAEAYVDGRYDTPDLVQLLTVLAANQPSLARAFYGNCVMRLLLRVKHALNANTKRGARRNIVAHYDLGNAFYGLWLDPTMTYSSALFDGDRTADLASAQQAKYERLLAELALEAGSQVLEIGCGWGGFAETAARAGHRVTGLSLSGQQTSYARDRLARGGLADRVQFHLRDYRDERGVYDAVASIEMVEAVGERWWPTYFRRVHDALRPGGRACVQSITIAEERFDRYRTQSDFIQQHIFPGGMLPSPSALVGHARAAGLEFVGVRTFGRDYAETLKRWLAAFDAAETSVRALGFDNRFIRYWRFYLAYCAAGFDTETTDVGQYTFIRR